jgi:predicted tellurium resistance membrane protein TerC
MGTRILLLLSLTWIMRLSMPLFSILGHGISGRDVILLAGGAFLVWKSTHEIRQRLKGESQHRTARATASMAGILIQIAIIDIVFSLDSVITAVGMANQLEIMIAAIVLAVGFMMFASGPLTAFLDRNPSVKMLALAFLLLVGGTLIAEGLDFHVSKDSVYFAMGFP